MRLISFFLFFLIVVTGFTFGQITNSQIKAEVKNYYLQDSCKDFFFLKNIQPITYYLVNSGGHQNPITLQNYPQLSFTKFYFESEKPTTIIDEKEEKSQSKWDWLYFAGTAVAAVIVYLVWPEKAPESKQSLTFGKPLPPR
jgi:hypothetical protein